MAGWKVFEGTGRPKEPAPEWPPAPPWRRFVGSAPDGEDDQEWPDDVEAMRRLGPNPISFDSGGPIVMMVNAAIHLRRALLVTGAPGVGKSTLAYLVAREMRLGPVLRWPITTRTTLQAGLYSYDALARLQAAQADKDRRPQSHLEPSQAEPGHVASDAERRLAERAGPVPSDGYAEIGRFLQLGPLGTALLPRRRPRVVLLDEIDKSDLDLPDDLLTVLEEGTFEIPELARHEEHTHVRIRTADDRTAVVERGRVTCREFPLVIMTSNKERDFPPAFMRRCLRLTIEPPEPDRLRGLIRAHLGEECSSPTVERLISIFGEAAEEASEAEPSRSPDQLLNALFIIARNAMPEEEAERLAASLFQPLES